MSAPQQQPAQDGPFKADEFSEWQTRAKTALNNQAWNSASPEGSQPWLNSIWGCITPPSTCLVTCCCPCITFGKTHHRLRHNGDMAGYSPVNTSCILFFASSYVCLNWVMNALQLQEIREKHNLEGSCTKDLACSFCCLGCSLCQAEKETVARAGEKGAVDQQYKAEQMVMPGAQN
ncbi:hypothetical protein BU24DRAFT_189240 [Aaosphaeria arxii CBS 175.79]|uniref:PLAC8-domain-containing protein n=1 Tax=Aaosphaeria arxii CBS 175.79 TaxID=1450172 RepID=A0A6A5XS30_9PLEO|nr:uncharacterized protein BU24DRAFT_189240 [Aaosphaeria arxii CBS 175.79]KAF2015972.1 hypothetical protein BU24DRAFT_189240 [Aaosphaeria arxii CBS 175.79]